MCSSEMLVPVYEAAWCYISEEPKLLSLNIQIEGTKMCVGNLRC